ncbi:hypothetical protein BJ508DRAFT_300808 [Ascobolus immersus RN42]|uniref:Nicotinamide N-methyltransferase n=1 Tax=Ascobolus immersus RN42 TaxID=1160509 RepID=A0A3N4IN40_ASCIM|nr:hypothetical protein BJ508DRAFT_300808 [Ascobolus immersus RN42]
MATIESRLSQIGYRVEDIDEEFYNILTTERPPPASLGFIVSKDDKLPVTVGPFELEVHQSKGLLNSKHEEGTTGAVVWRLSIPLAEFLLENFSSSNAFLNSNSTVLELGSGSSGVMALTVGRKVKRWIASDIDAIYRPLIRNLSENLGDEWSEKDGMFTQTGGKKPKGKKKVNTSTSSPTESSIEVVVINWEQTDLRSNSVFRSGTGGVNMKIDMIVCTDCVYNIALIKPLIDTMVEASRLTHEAHGVYPLVLVAQEVRADDVLEAFLTTFAELFEVWRIDRHLGGKWDREVGGSAVLHAGFLKDN